MGRAGRYRKEGERRARRARSAAARHVDEEPRWDIPPEHLWDPDYGTFPYMPTATVRIVQRIGRMDGRLVFYAIMLDCRDEAGQWENIWRIDCRHGSVHRHSWSSGMGERTVVQPIRTQEDVETTYEASYAEVETNWADMERRWRHARADRA